MKPVRPLVALAALVACVVAGVGLLAAASKLPRGAPQPVVMAAAFAALYVGVAWMTRRAASPTAPWRPAGLAWAPAWFAAGVVLKLMPHAFLEPAVVIERAAWSTALASTTATSVALTLAAVLWEELWFRNPVLNLVRPGPQQIVFAVANGALFTVLHVLNPAVDLAVQGPELFAAGALLTLVYFATGSFWAPLALHLGNNLAGATLRRAIEGGGDVDAPAVTVLRAGVLGVCCVVVSLVLLRRRRDV